MATAQIKTRILNKISSWTEWESVKSTFKPLHGEICIVEIPTGTSNTGLTPPATGMKVGDGEHFFGDLPWIQAIAGDVSSWCKTNMVDYNSFKTQVEAVINTTIGNLNTAIEGLDGRVEALEGAVGNAENGLVKDVAELRALTGEHTTNISNLTSNKVNKTVAEDATESDKLVKASTVDSKVSTAVSAAQGELNNQISAVDTKAGQALTAAGNAQQAADDAQADATANAGEITTIKGNITSINESIDEIKEVVGLGGTGEGETLTDRVEALETTVGDENNGLVKTVAEHTTAIGTLNSTTEGHGSRIEAAEGKLTTLIGTVEGDDAKSVRDIAADLIADSLASGGESFDTLQEIAAWIKDHPEDVAEMNKTIGENTAAIQENAGKIGTLETAVNTNIPEQFEEVEGSIDTLKTNILGGATYQTDTIASVKAAAAEAKSQADKGVSDAAAALAKANEKTTMAEVEAKNYATKTEAEGYATTAANNIQTTINAMDYNLADGEGLLATLTQEDGKITAHTRRKITMADISESDTFIFYCGTATDLT